MKKLYQLMLLMCLSSLAISQTPFFTPVTYRGAFAPAPNAMWTDQWTEWDPQSKVYAATTVDVTADITTNTTWTSGNVYHLKGVIYVKNNATLTIQPGTVIRGDKGTPNSSLVITRGAKINAAGTASAPIVFTSDQAAGQRNIGDWGGVILLGKASNNNPGDTAFIEGLAPTPDTEFGGGLNPDDNDNSGVMQYVRIEWAGYVFQPNKEINGLTFGAVGRGTTIDHIQVSFSNDDSYEWFGGTVTCKYLVAYRGLDDDFDTDNGFSGLVQFGLGVRDPQIADNPSVSTSEGFESDNDPTGSTATPQTKAIFSNMTIIGPFRGNPASTIASGYRRGARIRRNSALRILNSILMDHPRGVHIDGTASEANATSGLLKFAHNIVAGNSAGLVTEVNSGSTFNAPAWFATSLNDSFTSTSGILTTPYNYTSPDYRPASGSPALGGYNFSEGVFSGLLANVSPLPNFFYSQINTPGSRVFTFNNSTIEKGYQTTYHWDFGVSSSLADTSSVMNPSFTFPADGNYTVKLVARNAFGADSVMKNITVFAAPTNPFFTPTLYRGAFAPAPNAMWTDQWTEWDPQSKVYAATTVDVTADITTNTTWTSGNVYHLKGVIYVKNNATLTIQPGTVIRGDKGTPNSSLVITRGAKINAAGTASAPIVFTSDQAAGQRNIGDWGGVILLGKASNNNPGDTAFIEGLAPTPDTEFGGGLNPDDNDNSGVMQYVRIEWAGYVFQPNKEINGLTFGAVGRGTTIDHIQVSFSNDDSYEWFGGTVTCKYLVAYRGLDDDFDTDNGFSGLVQFGLGVRDPQIADNPSVSTSEGFESDNDPTGSTATPQTKAIFSNMTIIGPFRGNPASTIASGYRRGARIRRNSALRILNSILMDHPRGVHIDGTASEANATSGLLKFAHNIVAGNSAGLVTEVNSGSTFNAPAWFATSLNDSFTSTSGILTTPYNYTSPDYRPASGSPALGGADFFDPVFSGLIATVQKPAAGFTYMQDTAKGSLTFHFTNTTDEKGASVVYLWKFGVSSSTSDTSTAKTPSFTYPSGGTYQVRLIAFSNIGNDTMIKTITINPSSVPGTQDVISHVSLFPNPARTQFSLEFRLAAKADVSADLYSIAGQHISTLHAGLTGEGQQSLTISADGLDEGIYFVRLNAGTASATMRLVIVK
jgi:PKD repeat protein